MSKLIRYTGALAILGAIGLGAATLLGAPARASDYPCDPTYQLLKGCKAQHGRWDNACCCCKLH